MPLNINKDIAFNLQLSMGLLEGFDNVDKFGFNKEVAPSTDPEDFWEYGGVYNFTDDAGALYYFSSSDPTDTQEYLFYVLTVDSNGNWNREYVRQQAQGQTKVQLITPSGDLYVRIWRVQNVDSTQNTAGTLYVYEDTTLTAGVPDDSTKVRAIIDDGNNQTQMCIYTVPSGYVGFLLRGELGIELAGNPQSLADYANCTYLSRRNGELFTTKKTVSLIVGGNSYYQDVRPIPDIIPSKVDIKLQVKEVSDTMGVWGTFDILLIKEDMIPKQRLLDIGQPIYVP